MCRDVDVTDDLLERARRGDTDARDTLFARHRDRLRRMVEARLDHRLQARVDASDVVQDAFLDIAGRLAAYLERPVLPLFLWMRLVVAERLVDLHRHHLKAKRRDVGREVSLDHAAMPAAGSEALAAHLAGRLTSPTGAAVRAERVARLRAAMEALEPIDREILSLRHFEQLTRAEAARALGVGEEAAAKRYVRALRRLKDALGPSSGGPEGR